MFAVPAALASAAGTAGTISSIMGGLGSVGSFLGSVGGLFGGKKKGPTMQDSIDGQIQLQRKSFAQTMANAKKHGVHPIVALGMNPSAGGLSFSAGETQPTVDLAGIGQGLESAINRLQTPDQRGVTAAMTAQAVERGDLENELLKTQIAQARASLVPAVYNGSPQLIAGQQQTGLVGKLKEIIAGDDMEVGNPPAMATVNYKGRPVRIPGKAWGDGNIEDGPAAWTFQMANTVPDIIKAEFMSLIDQAVSGARRGWSLPRGTMVKRAFTRRKERR